MNAKAVKIYENAIYVEFKLNDKVLRKRKRVGKDCPLTAEQRKIYTVHGMLACVKELRFVDPSLSLQAAADIVRKARGKEKTYRDGQLVHVREG